MRIPRKIKKGLKKAILNGAHPAFKLRDVKINKVAKQNYYHRMPTYRGYEASSFEVS